MSYGIPGWARGLAAGFIGAMLAGAAIAYLVDVYAGAVVSVVGLAGCLLSWRAEDAATERMLVPLASVLMLSGYAPGIAVHALGLAADHSYSQLDARMPAVEAEAEEALTELLQGTYDLAFASQEAAHEGEGSYEAVIEAGGEAEVYAIGTIDLESCVSEATQSLTRLGGGSFLTLALGDQGRGVRSWSESSDSRQHDGRPVDHMLMLPYVESLRAFAYASDQPVVSLCGALKALPRVARGVEETPSGVLLRIDPARAEASARVGHVLRTSQDRRSKGTPKEIDLLLIMTRSFPPDLRGTTGAVVAVSLERDGDGLSAVSTFVGGGEGMRLYERVGLRASEAVPTGPPEVSSGAAGRAVRDMLGSSPRPR